MSAVHENQRPDSVCSVITAPLTGPFLHAPPARTARRIHLRRRKTMRQLPPILLENLPRNRHGALLLSSHAHQHDGRFHPRSLLLSQTLRPLLPGDSPRRPLLRPPLSKRPRRRRNQHHGGGDRLCNGLRKPRPQLPPPHAGKSLGPTARHLVSGEWWHFRNESRLRSRRSFRFPPQGRLQLLLLPRQLSSVAARQRPSERGRRLSRATPGRHRLSALPRSRKRTRRRGRTRASASRSSKRDSKPCAPHHRAPVGSVHAMPSGNHQLRSTGRH